MPPPTREGKEGKRLNSQILARGLRALPMTNDSGRIPWLGGEHRCDNVSLAPASRENTWREGTGGNRKKRARSGMD